MPQSGIYAIINNINSFRYVGSAVNFQVRRARHWRELRQGSHHSRHLQSAFNKYGESVFAFSILEEVEKDKQLLFQRENYWIHSLKPEYNVGQLDHTHLGAKRSEETKRVMSEKASLRKHTEESKQKMAEKKVGRKLSAETRQKMSEARHGRTFTEEQRKQISESNLGQKRSEEARKNIAQAHIGVKRSEESRRKQSETIKANGGPVFSEERRKNIAAGRKAAWDRKKSQQQAETLNIQQPKLFD